MHVWRMFENQCVPWFNAGCSWLIVCMHAQEDQSFDGLLVSSNGATEMEKRISSEI